MIGGTVVIALFGALIGPFFVDWTKYTQDFEREASRIIGQPVHVAGDAKVRILPFPTVTFADLSIGEYADGTAMMTVDGFSMDTELMPFLRGQVRIVEMRLIKPQLTVRVNENGTIDWTDRKQLLVNPENVELNRMRVENATIRLEGLAAFLAKNKRENTTRIRVGWCQNSGLLAVERRRLQPCQGDHGAHEEHEPGTLGRPPTLPVPYVVRPGLIGRNGHS